MNMIDRAAGNADALLLLAGPTAAEVDPITVNDCSAAQTESANAVQKKRSQATVAGLAYARLRWLGNTLP